MSILVANKLRLYVKCVACGKPRGVYSPKSVTKRDLNELEEIIDEGTYACGQGLVPYTSFLFRHHKPAPSHVTAAATAITVTAETAIQFSASNIVPGFFASVGDKRSRTADPPGRVVAARTMDASNPRAASASVAISAIVADSDDDEDASVVIGGESSGEEDEIVPSSFFVNPRAVIVRRSVDCGTPIEAAFYSSADPSKSRMLEAYRRKAFGNTKEGGEAPYGWCIACGETNPDEMLVFETE